MICDVTAGPYSSIPGSVVEVARWLGNIPDQVAKIYARPMPSRKDKARRTVESASTIRDLNEQLSTVTARSA